ncbi:MAG: S4 domain-containing protein [Methylococcales bacterium]|nr:S4 domain-containing protein [Methylococcales bacterium]
MAQQLTAMRLDKWLWAARFYKTRRLANEAIAGGKVHVNGQRAKPSKEIQVGSQLAIHKEPYRWDITVTALNQQRRPAPEAALLYQEDEASRAARALQIAQHKEASALLPPVLNQRPNKKERRLIHRFKRG